MAGNGSVADAETFFLPGRQTTCIVNRWYIQHVDFERPIIITCSDVCCKRRIRTELEEMSEIKTVVHITNMSLSFPIPTIGDE